MINTVHLEDTNIYLEDYITEVWHCTLYSSYTHVHVEDTNKYLEDYITEVCTLYTIHSSKLCTSYNNVNLLHNIKSEIRN